MRAAPVRLYGRCVRSIGRLTASGGMCASKTLVIIVNMYIYIVHVLSMASMQLSLGMSMYARSKVNT